ncbi:protein DA1 [Thermogemmatispora tikiterensis]|uniref:LIM zinc-binding domain-containing protein n=1 Tax=Thermogemmatispora tikiterensis TaxID=1825093 RepID=A0A328VKY9_9CHLR|nr:protein DA1 [Thermogemmatispora tikiterensis]RAQ96852.1 hypothetical protein A4R35_15045 [Thermogemmatispora tikiterensis]
MSRRYPRFCHLCGTPLALVGRYLIYPNGLVICPACEGTAPRCQRCGLPGRHLEQVGGALLCPTCRAQVAFCACCGRALLEAAYVIGDSPLRYCQRCLEERPRCDVCQAPLNEQGRLLPGRHGESRRCAACWAEAVHSPDEAAPLYQRIFLLLPQEPGLTLPALPRLHLCERALLQELHQQRQSSLQPGEEGGVGDPHLLGIFLQQGREQDIYIEHYLPRDLFQAVVAHELAHAWQAWQGLEGLPLVVGEGFAEWTAYHVLQALGEERMARRLLRRRDLYGQGLQRFLTLEQQQGRAAVLAAARGSLPL